MAKKGPKQPPNIILDQFSDADIRTWNKLSELWDEYHVKLFYHLESLRSLHHKELCNALLNSKVLKIEKENWWRYVDFKFSNEFLSSRGSLIKGGRFNIGNDVGSKGFKSFPVLYIAETEETARAEKFGVPKAANGLTDYELALRSLSSFTAVKLKFDLNSVFDLTKASTLIQFTEIISNFQLTRELKELAGMLKIRPPYLVTKPSQLKETLLADDWRHYPVQYEIPANSQLFGRMLRDAGFEAVIYPSMKLKGKKCIAVFTENLNKSESYIELQDPAPDSVKHTKLWSENWKELSS